MDCVHHPGWEVYLEHADVDSERCRPPNGSKGTEKARRRCSRAEAGGKNVMIVVEPVLLRLTNS